MAEDLADGEFWLPSEFLADDCYMEEKKDGAEGGVWGLENDSGACFPVDFPYGFGLCGSGLCSPVESMLGSTGTESDEDDMAGLTQQMARSTLQGEDWAVSPTHAKGVAAGSPQSTLCVAGAWSSSSSGSSNGTSQVSSPPSATPISEREEDPWELLYAAAGQVMKIKMNSEEANKIRGRGVLGAPRKQSSADKPSFPVKAQSTGFYQSQFNQIHQLEQQQMNKQPQQHHSSPWGSQGVKSASPMQQRQPSYGGNVFAGARVLRPLGLPSSAWPPLHHPQRQPSSGMRAVFLGGAGSRRESCGTGVFLPRTTGNSEIKKKPARSTVLLPARVVQALNLNLDELDPSMSRLEGFHHLSNLNEEAMLKRGNGHQAQLQRQSMRTRPPTRNNEIHLPHEWTY